MMMPLVVILAGGEGSRMGGGKPLRMLGGETLIARARRRAEGWSDGVRIALRDPAQAGPFGADALLDDPDVWGPLAGLKSALAAARSESRARVLTLPCDMPFLPADLLERLSGTIGDKGAALASSDGQLHPVCGLWSVRVLDLMPAYLGGGRRSLKGLAEQAGFVAVEWPEASFINLNTPEELASAERRVASEIEH